MQIDSIIIAVISIAAILAVYNYSQKREKFILKVPYGSPTLSDKYGVGLKGSAPEFSNHILRNCINTHSWARSPYCVVNAEKAMDTCSSRDDCVGYVSWTTTFPGGNNEKVAMLLAEKPGNNPDFAPEEYFQRIV